MDNKLCCAWCGETKVLSEFYTSQHTQEARKCKACLSKIRTARRRARGIQPISAVVTDTHQRCCKCGAWKLFSDFAASNTRRIGRQRVCKACQHDIYTARVRNTGVKARPVVRVGNLKLCSVCKTWQDLTAYHKYKRSHDGRVCICKTCMRPINQRSRQKRRNAIRQRARDRRKYDIDYKLRMNLTRRVNEVLRDHIKSATTMRLVGCTTEELKLHLERQFKPGMSWANHTVKGWHIDHIRPCASFDLTAPEQQKQCFHYTNLQPLWAGENYSKGDKYEPKEKHETK